VKSAKKIVDKKEPVVWDILENVIKGHPVLLNRAPTLHRLGIQAFQPKLIEGKAIQLHPLSTTAFNADFDGDQMAVHLPLGHAAVLEAQLLMLASHNILNPANGAPIAVPSQDMVLGLYYITKGRKSEKGNPVQGEGSIFYSPEEVNIAFNEKRLDMHAWIKVRWTNPDGSTQLIETTTGRVIFNALVPEELGYINEVLTKRSLRDIIGRVVRESGVAKAAKFLDDIKELGFMNAFRGGLSFNLADVVIPAEKEKLIAAARSEADEVTGNYNMGLITNNERYNQTIDIWTHTNSKLTFALMERLKNDNQGFNSIYMMMDSGARGSKEQIRQLSGMRGLMAKPQKSGGGQDIIENPILSNFKEGLSILEYFISTHGARKGLADTALKTADAGYLTRRLVDVAQDVVISADDCGTLRGLVVTDLVKNDEVVEKLSDRILGRTVVNDVVHPQTGELIIASGENVTEQIAEIIGNSPIEEVEVRSVLTCEQRHGVCTKCYGRNLATGRMVQIGEAVGVIAAQSIGEPGTQLTLRTFHVGGVAGKITEDSRIVAKYDGRLEIDELRTVKKKDRNGQDAEVVISRSAEMRIVDANTGIVLTTNHIPYGAMYHGKVGKPVAKGELIADWDPYNAVIISELSGLLAFENIEENATFREEIDEQTGFTEKVIVESRDKRKNPTIRILDVKTKEEIKSYSLPVGAHISVNDGAKVEAGDILVKIPRTSGKGGDITGGLPRVTELFEARNPSNPAVVSEIDGIVSYGKIKRGNREIIVESRIGEHKYYLVPLSKHILVQENDFVKAGQPLSDGATSPSDILDIQGPTRVQEYLVDEVQDVYRMQGVKINDKHFEVIVRQMMRKVEIEDPGDTRFLERQAVMKAEFMEENDNLFDKLVVANAGDSPNVKEGQMITLRKLRDENSVLKRKDGKLVETRPATPATSKQLLMGITRASLQTESFISAASFQETTKVLNEAAVAAKEDSLLGLKENVIVGHLIPAGTGTRSFQKDLVYSKDEYTKLMAAKLTAQEIEE
ncbi:MAG TPA: DNA-directed RNA polymerase subunit beta', partial [Flavobacteriales bacterium]|nr:DNA-directed RNA polymerase subunit beta' [Flavobacteriales bacterium]